MPEWAMGALPLRPDCSLIICSDWILLPSCCLFYSLTYISFIINLNMTGGVKWHPCLEGTLTSPGTHGTLCVRPFSQWNLGLDRSQSRVSPYRPIPVPWVIGTSSRSPCSLFLMHPWVFGELFCLFVHVFTEYMSHIFIRTLLGVKQFIKWTGWMHAWKDKGINA